MGRLAALAILAVTLVLPTGCTREEEGGVPVACKAGEASVRGALGRAPGRVSMEGRPLSACLARSSDPADLQVVGAVFIGVAEDLARSARSHPDGPAATQLGYLMGSARRGAHRTQGIHSELVRRMEQELVVVDTSTAAFRRGERAGRESG